MESDNQAILLKANELITIGDNEGFLSFCTDDTQWEFVGDQKLSGKQAVRAYMLRAYKEPPLFDLQNVIAAGDYVTAIGKINMKNDSGKMTSYAYCDVWRFSDGKMAELKAFVIELS